MRADDRALPDYDLGKFNKQFTLTRLPQRGIAKPVVPPAVNAAVARPEADAGPQTFVVDSDADQPDADVGDGVCAVDALDGGGCTLRAAIQEANASTDKDTITFSVATVAPTSTLPAITEPVIIDGGTASATAISGSAESGNQDPALTIEGGNSTIENLTVDNFANIGILLTGGVGHNIVTGCRIGTDPSGGNAAPNGDFGQNSAGIEIADANSVIGGPQAADRNIISGNDAPGIVIATGGDGTLVEGNTIGLDASGTSSLPNDIGVLVTYFGSASSSAAKNVVVGGPDPDDGNLISGNAVLPGSTSTLTYLGLDIDAAGTTVSNNVIGLNAEGDPVGNGIGAWVSNAANVVVGEPGAGNVISGNKHDGLRLDGAADTGDVIQANDIGTDPDSDPGLGNGGPGIGYYYEPYEATTDAPSNVTIGGVGTAGNVISGNGGAGIHLDGPGGNTVSGNHIGTNAAGSGKLHNSDDAIQVENSPNNVIGGTASGSGNVVAGNKDGVLLDGSATTKNLIEGNAIGILGDNKVGIGGSGVSLTNQASGNVIGYSVDQTPQDVCAGACNIIADTSGDGVALDGTVNDDTIRGNWILDVSKLPIAFIDKPVDANEPLPNDEHDADEGANGAINFPTAVMSTIQPNNPGLPIYGGTIVTGTLSPRPASTASEVVDIYGLSAGQIAADPQPADQVDSWGAAPVWLGTATVQPDGTFYFGVPHPGVFVSYSATATDADGNTSEVSPICAPLAGQTSDDADGDGICDEWETRGLDFDGDGKSDLDLKAYGASPTRRDLFAEVDYYRGFAPKQQALVDVQEAFADSPVSATNDPSHTGIRLHLGATTDDEKLSDDEVSPRPGEHAMTQSQLIDIRDGDRDCAGVFGSLEDRNSSDCWQILGAKHMIWRYIFFGDAMSGGPNVTGEADIAGRTAVITLGPAMRSSRDPNALRMPRTIAVAGGWPTQCTDYASCLAQVQAATMMHEFGHTLGLHHGGGDDTNFKPNYLSVMNYNLLYRDVVPNRPLDYSRASLPSLNEGALNENAAIAGTVKRDTLGDWTTTVYQGPTRNSAGNVVAGSCGLLAASIFTPIDWNDNGRIDTSAVTESQSDDSGAYGCSSPVPVGSQLTSHDDWAGLQYTPVPVLVDSWAWAPQSAAHARADTSDASTSTEPGIDPWQQAMSADADHDGIVNTKDNCPTVSNHSQASSSVKGIGKACVSLIKERDLNITMKVTGKAKKGKLLHLTVSLHDSYPLAATGDVVSVKVPRGLTLKSAKASSGKFQKSSGHWVVRTIGGEKTVTLSLVLVVKGKLPTTATAELIKAGQRDPNSTPNNHNPFEDDEARKVIG